MRNYPFLYTREHPCGRKTDGKGKERTKGGQNGITKINKGEEMHGITCEEKNALLIEHNRRAFSITLSNRMVTRL